MAERRENSVLFSLKELRRIEDDRVKKEEDEAKARSEAERAAKEAALRQSRDDEERRRREEEDRLRRIEEEKESKVREEQIRLQEAERRHRVEGELRLQEERMRLEVQSRAGKSPLKAIIGVTVALVAIAGGLGYKMYSDHQMEMKVANARAEELERQNKLAQAEYERKMVAIQKEMDDKLRNAKSDDERARIRADAEAEKRAAAAIKTRQRPSRASAADKDKDSPAAPNYKKVQKRDVSNNPLEGLPSL
jgi:hypothetical protein